MKDFAKPRDTAAPTASDPWNSIAGRRLTSNEIALLRVTPIEELRLSVRATHVIEKIGWRAALDIAIAPISFAMAQRNCGRKTVDELRDAALTVIGTNPTRSSIDNSVIGRPMTSKEIALLRGIPTSELTLSLRARLMVNRLEWRTALDIATAPVSVALAQRACRPRTLAEIRNVVLMLLKTNSAPNPTNSSIVGRSITNDEAELLRATPIEELGLSVRARHVVDGFKWRTGLDIAPVSASVALGRRNCGRKTVAELRAAVLKALEAGAIGEPEISTECEAVRGFIDEMVGSVKENAGLVLRERFALWDGARETLEDISWTLGVSRERVRQIEDRSLRRLRESPWRRPGLRLLTKLREEILACRISSNAWGVVTQHEMNSLVDPELADSLEEEQKVRLLAFLFLCAVFLVEPSLGTRGLIRVGDQTLFISQDAAERFKKVEAAARSLLISQGRPVALSEAARALPKYGAKTTEAELERFGEVSSVIGVDWTRSLGLRRWKFFKRRNLAALIQRALIELGEPTHFSYIADRANAIAPNGRHLEARLVPSTMQRFPDVFVGLGRGIYALRDWGIARPPFIKDFLIDEIQNRGGRAHIDDLAMHGGRRYGFKKTSILMTLSMNPQRFRDLGNGWYAVA